MSALQLMFHQMAMGELSAWLTFLMYLVWPVLAAIYFTRLVIKSMLKHRTDEEKAQRRAMFKAAMEGVFFGTALVITVFSIGGLLELVISPETKHDIAMGVLRFFNLAQ